jgi:solute carrier family 36 (proton-coupled amino acid transporter)
MPVAFSYVGLVGGVLATLATSILCTHCSYLVVKSSTQLCARTGRTTMTYPEVAEAAFAEGPNWCRKLAKIFVLYCLFLAYFGSSSVYSVIVASTLKQIIEYHTEKDVNIRYYLLGLLLPLILLSWIPDLKWLAPISLMANVFMGTGLGLTIYYLVTDVPAISNELLVGSLELVPSFFAIVIFAIQAIGVVMPLRNQMLEPENFVGPFGVLSQGMAIVTVIYAVLGFLGYLKYGADTADSITLNLPEEG